MQNQLSVSTRPKNPPRHSDTGNRVDDISGRRLVDVYQRTFEVLHADTEALRKQAFRLRYQVYCVEHPFEDPADNPEGIETDEFDSHSMHSVLVHRQSGLPAGAVRLVLPLADAPHMSFAVQRVCEDPMLRDFVSFPMDTVGEISRFCISKNFRRRHGDNLYADGAPPPEDEELREKRAIPNMTLGLIEGLVRMSIDQGVLIWCAVMEPTLLRLLRRLGIYFEHVGPMVEFHGKRQPCYQRLDRLLERVREEQPEVWEVLTDKGKHWDALMDMKCRMGVPAAAE